ncbi:hypothetical protein BDQ17DRAFT_1357028 [Cyathus striatus]|nr:hypothetical protein BDQ17DRAFT_1357028 [Cyathus striatus]
MLRTLLTPIRAKFDLSPSSATLEVLPTHEDDDQSPEDFARDVLIEVMRNSVENLKHAENAKVSFEVLTEIHRIVLQDSCTKDVFREMDGFLVLMSVLSTIYDMEDGEGEGARLVFMILSETMYEHQENLEYFRHCVGYESLAFALRGLVAHRRTSEETLGFLLSLAIHDFSISGIFSGLRGAKQEDIDMRFLESGTRLGTIHQPEPIHILWTLAPRVTANNDSLRYAVYKLFESLSYVGHRNQAVLSSLSLVKPVFNRFYETRNDASVSEKERYVLQKLLRRILDVGATTVEVRPIMQKAVRDDGTLDPEAPAAVVLTEENVRGLPPHGFTFMARLCRLGYGGCLPKKSPHELFSVRLGTGGQGIRKSRWTHVSLIHYPHRSSNPSIRFKLQYPRQESVSLKGTYTVGDASTDSQLSWCLASAYLIALPLADDLPRLIHHLGPRYSGNFQDPAFVKFLTYEASTSLSMFYQIYYQTPWISVKYGLGVPENTIIFSFSAAHSMQSGHGTTIDTKFSGKLELYGDVFTVKAVSLDTALWRIGGAAVPLRIVQFANTSHELSRAISILTDGLRNNWQNSEDMERLRGYEILADILRSRAQLINLTCFETLFEFLGLDFRSPEHSTVVNIVGYKAIALDFELWARTKNEIQRVHLEHFVTLLQTSRYKVFNVRQRLSKLGLVRKFLLTLQVDCYSQESVPVLLEALKAAWMADFSKEGAIKPVVAYLAAGLHGEDENLASSPSSIISRYDPKRREKAEQVLELLITTLASKAYYTKFISALPIPRICLLLLGDRPSTSFELVSGWTILKTVLPHSWDLSVNEAAFNILFGRFGEKMSPSNDGLTVTCSSIFPTILSALQTGLINVANSGHLSEEQESQYGWSTESVIDVLVEDFMNLHSSSATFRQLFRSHQSTQIFIDSYRNFVSKITLVGTVNSWTTRILERLTHLGLALALDDAVSGHQKREILETIQSAESILHPSVGSVEIDPTLVADNRTVRQRIAERTVMKSITRIEEWRKTIQDSERKRLRKNLLDLREQRRQVARLQDWTNLLSSERGLWPEQEVRLWRLDETEGPYRVRKKMEPQNDKAASSRIDLQGLNIRNVEAPESDTQSIRQPEVPPWADNYEIASTEIDDRQLAEDIVDDKLRRIRHELEPGDVIEAVGTVARVVGVDSSPGLLIIGRTHVYMLDGVVENSDGEVIDAHDAPKSLLFVPGSTVELDGPQRAQRWPHNQIAAYSNKKFLFRDVALEVYFKDSRSLLIVFLDKKKRNGIDHRLSTIIQRNPEAQTNGSVLRTPIFGRMNSKPLTGWREDELPTATRKWQAREISNFTYLSLLNQISGRTPSDATQYPVFPWSHKADGRIDAVRREAAEARYSNLESVGEQPFHYGTHFSSSMIVCHFLIRMAPYTNMFKTLQGGDWDLPDRLFSDMARAYDSAARDPRGDVRELIPEFYTCPEFLENSANLDFGKQSSGEQINHVKLPPWARDDPLLFITLNRKALESDYVSEQLPAWIDLIWGCKQRDPASLNCFHPLSYEGSIDLDAIKDDLEREATVGIIHNFGQTPRKIFTVPHPERFNHGLISLPLGTLHGIEEDAHLLTQGNRCFKDLGSDTPVRELVLDGYSDKLIPCPEGLVYVPMFPYEHIKWKPNDGELLVVVDNKVVETIEDAFCTCAAFADPTALVTGSSDYAVRLWKYSRPHAGSGSNAPHLSLSHIMRVHTDEVVSVTASRTWSLVVSGSKDGSAAIWDLNRGAYIRSITHGDGGEATSVNLVAINESTGYIATCSRTKLYLHTINARLITTLDLTTTPSYSSLVPTITCMAFHEREYSRLGVLATGGADGTITLRTWTADGTPEGQKAQWEFVTIKNLKVRLAGTSQSRLPSVTAVKFQGETLCHGEETGKSYMWNLPE